MKPTTATTPKGSHIFTYQLQYFKEQDKELKILKNTYTKGRFEVHAYNKDSSEILAYFKLKREAKEFVKKTAPLQYIKENVVVFDNEGETFDRYTALDTVTGEMIGSSANPFHPQGFGQHCGNVAWDYYATTVGNGFIRRIEETDKRHFDILMRTAAKEQAELFKAEGTIGKIVTDITTLPADVIQFIKQSFID